MKRFLKRLFQLFSYLLVTPCGLLVALEKYCTSGGESTFIFWTHVFSGLPGKSGMFLRRAYYQWTLDQCSPHCFIGFGSFFTHRQAIVEPEVYIGPYAIIGSAHLHRGALIGSRSSLLSGGNLHHMDEFGRWMPSDMSKMQQINIGSYCWIGEGAMVMADIGSGALVATGAVVSTPVPDHVMVAGNPARFVKRLLPAQTTRQQPSQSIPRDQDAITKT